MNRTRIEYCDYTWNPVTGCLHGCPYCYARRISLRRGDDFKPKLHPERLHQPIHVKKPSKIFAVDMGDLFGDWVPREWIEAVLRIVGKAYWHTFLFLTKNPKRYLEFQFPENAWIGITIDTQKRAENLKYLLQADATIKFVSFEPLLEKVDVDLRGVDWIIIGAQTKPEIQPPDGAVKKLLLQTDRLGIPVFMKDNLRLEPKRREFPQTRHKPHPSLQLFF